MTDEMIDLDEDGCNMKQPIKHHSISEIAETDKTDGKETYLIVETTNAIYIGKLETINVKNGLVTINSLFNITKCTSSTPSTETFSHSEGRFYHTSEPIYNALTDTCSKISALSRLKNSTLKAATTSTQRLVAK